MEMIAEFDLGPMESGARENPNNGLFHDDRKSAAQPIGRGIVPKGVSLPAELFVQLRQITMRLKKIGSMFQGFLIRRDGSTLLLSILKNDAKVEIREREFRLVLQGTPVAGFRVGQVAKVVVQEPQIDVGIGQGRM